jgi:8-oxo-dGTP pyrophosphatase MutT (NUDIX family)
LLRNDKYGNSWGLPGGKVENNETLRMALERECREEIQFWTNDIKLFPLEQYTSDDGKFIYHTFYSIVGWEFKPVLNHEHSGYCWVDDHCYPSPLHRGLFNTLNYDIIKQKISVINQSLK